MHLPLALALLFGMWAQSTASTCPADRPVDDLIAAMRKEAKKKERNKNPLPDGVCIFGWCSRIKTPASQQKPAADQLKSAEGNPGDYSTSRTPEAECDRAMEIAHSAAHNVEVGDYNFAGKNYRGALLRYHDALAEKPQDIAIHVRLGRVFERLNQVDKAREHYQSALKLPGPASWTEEASSAVQRLQN